MRILVSGSTGFIGGHLTGALISEGHSLVRLVRSGQEIPGKSVVWDPDKGRINKESMENLDAVIHLAGENIIARWTEERKEKILKSRTVSTALLSEAIAQLKVPPKLLISASAVGFYGDRGSELLDEDSSPGSGFLSEVCKSWEAAALPAAQAGVRVITTRFGLILSPDGGALARMLPAFKSGLGGRLGNGNQYVSWIAIDDIIGVILFLLTSKEVAGPVNVVSPNPVTNREFTKILAGVLSRPAFFGVPASVLELTFGKEMADSLLLTSTRVRPKKLTQNKYIWRYPELENALKHLLK